MLLSYCTLLRPCVIIYLHCITMLKNLQHLNILQHILRYYFIKAIKTWDFLGTMCYTLISTIQFGPTVQSSWVVERNGY